MNSPSRGRYVTWADWVFNPWVSGVRTVASSHGEWVSDDEAMSPGDPADAIAWDRDAEGFARETGRRRRVFAGPWCRVFDAGAVPSEREAFWQLVRQTPSLDWLVLLDSTSDASLLLPHEWPRGFHNVWLGVKVSGGSAASDITALRRVPAHLRFLLAAPLLDDLGDLDLVGIDWVVLCAQPVERHEFDIVASVRLQCAAYGVPCWFEDTDHKGALANAGATWQQEPKRRAV